ncbi:hypothetical protein OH76DRAFT_1406808 [Lentinus brumalis]|uniref:Uncharacterized protein n=1 Tax=Lentinus brumalis TaxID=2498619 RepID=A0A371D1V0_9APHY|nr:hypothetical protein OH76DRAFT_1406808 [Polyporus brumalis]
MPRTTHSQPQHNNTEPSQQPRANHDRHHTIPERRRPKHMHTASLSRTRRRA